MSKKFIVEVELDNTTYAALLFEYGDDGIAEQLVDWATSEAIELANEEWYSYGREIKTILADFEADPSLLQPYLMNQNPSSS